MKLVQNSGKETTNLEEIKKIVDLECSEKSYDSRCDNIKTMLEFDERMIDRQLDANKFEIQKTYFMITLLILVLTLSDFEKLPSDRHLVIIFLIVICFGITLLIFFGRTVDGDINREGSGIENHKTDTALRSVQKEVTRFKKGYLNLVDERVKYNNTLFVIVLILSIILIMSKTNLFQGKVPNDTKIKVSIIKPQDSQPIHTSEIPIRTNDATGSVSISIEPTGDGEGGITVSEIRTNDFKKSTK